MLFLKRIFASFLAFLFSIFPFLGTTETDPDSYKVDNNKLSVYLTSNASTGYSWKISDISESVIKLEKEEYDNSMVPPGMVGASNIKVYTFKAVSEGKFKIQLIYDREWENMIPLKICVIKGSVTKTGEIVIDSFKLTTNSLG